jgi:hypothetical protein
MPPRDRGQSSPAGFLTLKPLFMTMFGCESFEILGPNMGNAGRDQDVIQVCGR